MKIFRKEPKPIKMCHARPGDIIQKLNSDLEPTDGLFVVGVFPAPNRAPRKLGGMGLYNEDQPLFLVNLETGEAGPLPHLSSRVVIVKDMALVEGYRGRDLI